MFTHLCLTEMKHDVVLGYLLEKKQILADVRIGVFLLKGVKHMVLFACL